MCLPAGALAFASIGSTILSTGFKVLQARQQAKAIERQGEFQAAILRNNQRLAEAAARDAEKRGRLAAQQKRIETGLSAGRQQAILAANGLSLNTGTAIDILGDTHRFGELDALTIINNSQREAFQFRSQGQNFGQEAALVQAQGQNQASALRSSTIGTVLSGVGSVASKWYSFGNEGIEPFASFGSGFGD